MSESVIITVYVLVKILIKRFNCYGRINTSEELNC